MLTNGTQQALYLVMRLLIDPGDTSSGRPWLSERTPNHFLSRALNSAARGRVKLVVKGAR